MPVATSAEADQKDCSICKCPLGTETAQLLPCKHIFDKSCIENWFKVNVRKTCPFRCAQPTRVEIHTRANERPANNPWSYFSDYVQTPVQTPEQLQVEARSLLQLHIMGTRNEMRSQELLVTEARMEVMRLESQVEEAKSRLEREMQRMRDLEARREMEVQELRAMEAGHGTHNRQFREGNLRGGWK
jgi:hypothetical protein